MPVNAETGAARRASLPKRWTRALLILTLAWLALGTLNWLSRAAYTPLAVLTVTFAAAVLSYVVWRQVVFRGWPDRVGVRFVAAHLVFSSVFAATLLFAGHSIEGAAPNPVVGRDTLTGSDDASWQDSTSLVPPAPRGRAAAGSTASEAVLAFFLYVIVAGLAYVESFKQQLARQQEAAAKAAAIATRAQLEALRGQLNPHFIFNALHSFAGLARRDPAALEEAIERLGSLLRYVLDADVDNDVTFDDERRFVLGYIELEKLGMGDRLIVEWSVEPGAGGVRMPPFTMQTLVENAVRHGIAPRPEGGRVQISARRENGRLVVRVVDDGVGARPDAIPAGGGRGLATIREALAVRYGDAAALSIETSPTTGFTAEFRIPCV